MLIALLAPLALAASPILDSITVKMPDIVEPRRHDLAQSVWEVELGESLPGATVSVAYDQQRADHIQVELRYETSITMMFEGPHWDLTDFQHHRSEWIDARPTSAGFVLPIPSDEDLRRFPAVTQAEIDAAVRSYLSSAGERLDQPPTCTDPWSSPCNVGVSTMWLRITAQKDGRTVEQKVITVPVPMGC